MKLREISRTMSITATFFILSTLIVLIPLTPFAAADACYDSHCYTQYQQKTTANGNKGTNDVSDPTINSYFVVAPIWIVFQTSPNLYWVEIGVIKGSNAGVCSTASSATFYAYWKSSVSGEGCQFYSGTATGIHTFEVRNKYHNSTWQFLIDGSTKKSGLQTGFQGGTIQVGGESLWSTNTMSGHWYDLFNITSYDSGGSLTYLRWNTKACSDTHPTIYWLHTIAADEFTFGTGSTYNCN